MEELLALINIDAIALDVHRGAKARMHRPAMVALEIILAVGLPVHGDVAVLRHEIVLLFERIVGRHVMDRAKPFDQARAAALQSNEDEAAPFLGVDGIEAPGPGIEIRVAAEIGRLVQPSVALIAPAMIGADDKLTAMAGAVGEELRAAMTADIVEGADFPVVVADPENRIAGDSSGHRVAWIGQPLGPRKQHPVLRENLAPLALELRGIAIGAGGRRPIEFGGVRHRCVSNNQVR